MKTNSKQDILNAIWDKFDYYQNLDSVDMEGTKDINDFLLTTLTEFEREIKERIKLCAKEQSCSMCMESLSQLEKEKRT